MQFLPNHCWATTFVDRMLWHEPCNSFVDLDSQFHSTHLTIDRAVFAISRRYAYCSIPHMIKHTFFTMVSMLCALSLRAQSEPQKSPLIGNTPPPPDLHK